MTVEMLGQLTPVILTFEEEPNIGRCLQQLSWARRIVVVDSGSRDGTLSLVRADPRVVCFYRLFDNHANQWNFALSCVETPWVLALDADYLVSDSLAREIAALDPNGPIDGYSNSFQCVFLGRPLRYAMYPPSVTLYRRAQATYFQDGHTQRLRLAGNVSTLRERMFHDDRKPLSRWLSSQCRYAELEAAKICDPLRRLSIVDRVRRMIVVAPVVVPIYLLLLRGGWCDGFPGLYYAVQRTVAELILSMRILEFRVGLAREPTSKPRIH